MTAATNRALSRFNPAQPGAAGMKVLATGLLVVMAGVFVAARAFEARYPALAYVKAFAEAAMVAGLPTGSRSPICFAPVGCRFPTPRSSAHKDASGKRSPASSRKLLIASVVARACSGSSRRRTGRFLTTPGAGQPYPRRASRLTPTFSKAGRRRLWASSRGASPRASGLQLCLCLPRARSASNDDRHVPMSRLRSAGRGALER